MLWNHCFGYENLNSFCYVLRSSHCWSWCINRGHNHAHEKIINRTLSTVCNTGAIVTSHSSFLRLSVCEAYTTLVSHSLSILTAPSCIVCYTFIYGRSFPPLPVCYRYGTRHLIPHTLFVLAVWRIRDVYPGSRIRLFSIPDPNCLHPGSRILIKEFKYFNPQKSNKWFLSSKKYAPGCSSRIPDPDADFLPSRIPDPGVKQSTQSRIPDPDPQHCVLVQCTLYVNVVKVYLSDSAFAYCHFVKNCREACQDAE